MYQTAWYLRYTLQKTYKWFLNVKHILSKCLEVAHLGKCHGFGLELVVHFHSLWGQVITDHLGLPRWQISPKCLDSWRLAQCRTYPPGNYLPWKLHSTWKWAIPKRKLVFQPSIFRGYVSFREGNIFSRYVWGWFSFSLSVGYVILPWKVSLYVMFFLAFHRSADRGLR